MMMNPWSRLLFACVVPAPSPSHVLLPVLVLPALPALALLSVVLLRPPPPLRLLSGFAAPPLASQNGTDLTNLAGRFDIGYLAHSWVYWLAGWDFSFCTFRFFRPLLGCVRIPFSFPLGLRAILCV